MMTESVSVTVQSGNGQPTNNQANKDSPAFMARLNILYFRTIPGIIKLAQLEDEQTEEQSSEDKIEEEGQVQKSKEELQLEQTRREEWAKLLNFLETRTEQMLDAISFNASTNLYGNDLANLSIDNHWEVLNSQPRGHLESLESLIDLASLGSRHLCSMSWHFHEEGILACAYSDCMQVGGAPLIAMWSLDNPLRPKLLLQCEQQICLVAFCPSIEHGNLLVAGCLDGTLALYEVQDQAKSAISSAKAHRLAITSMQWLPSWCRVAPDGNLQKACGDSSTICLATSSADGSICFWNLPSLSPIYRLRFEGIPVASFLLPLAHSEESSGLSLRDQADLQRLRKVFVGSRSGEVLYFGWESQTFAVEVSDQEVCKLIVACQAHDGPVRRMTKSPHLDDLFLSVGGHVFAIWKEDFPRAPLVQRRCKRPYADGCWSARSGMFVLVGMDGQLELWDMSSRSEEPVLLHSLSGELSLQVTACICPSPQSYKRKLLAALDGAANVRVFVEAEEAARDLQRTDWLEELAWRETKRKLDFHRWQDEYLVKNPVALRRKKEREQAEASRRHREAKERFLKLLGILCMALGGNGWFMFVAVAAFIMTLIWCVVYFFSVRENLNIPINWILTELLNTSIWTVFYLTAFIVQFALGFHYGPYIAAAVFGILNTLAYAAGAYFLYLEYKN